MTKLVNRAKMTTATTGTGTITLGSAVDGYQTFAAAGVADADVVRYVIEDGTDWEIGTGTYSSGTLTRSASESSNAGSAISLSGDAVVYVSAVEADFRESRVGTVTGNATLDLPSGTVFEHTPTADTTFVFNNPPVSGTAYSFTLKVTGANVFTGYDLANAEPPTYGYFSVSAQEPAPNSVFFKPDGTKMYITGSGSDAVYEYDLSTAWDISTASYLQNFSVSAQENTPAGLFFKPDGLKMYIIGASGVDVNQYDLSTAWDVTTASYVQNFSVSAQDTSPQGLFFKPDGLKMYVIGIVGDAVYEYDLSTAWDITTASYLQNFSASAQEAFPRGLFFKPDGTKMYITGSGGDDVNEYDLSTAWDISTASYVQSFSVTTQEPNSQSLFFKPDGLKMYIVGTSNDAVFSYTLTTAWDVSTLNFDYPAEGYFSVSAQESSPTGLFFKPDGLKMYVIGTSLDAVNEYNLSTAWDVSTASYLQNIRLFSQETNPHGLFFKPDGTKMYVTGSSGDDVNEYDLSTAWDVTTASYVQNFSVSAQDTFPTGLFFKPDGLKMYVIGNVGDAVYEYNLSTAWDVTTASYVQNFSVSAQDTSPQGLFFKPDGLKMYVIGSIGDAVWAYTTSSLPSEATFTYPASVDWPSGTAPTSPAEGETDIYTFLTVDGGTTYYGVQSGDDFS